MPRKPTDRPACARFAALLAQHLKGGTRPDGASDEPWTYAAFARTVLSSRDKDDPHVSERSVSNWCKGTSLPEEIAPILRTLFGPHTNERAAAREALRDAFTAARSEKATALLLKEKPELAGGIWVENVAEQQLVLDETASVTDELTATDPSHRQLQNAIASMAKELAEESSRLENTRYWRRLPEVAAAFHAVVAEEPSALLSRLGEAYPLLVRLGGFLEMDLRVQNDRSASDNPLDHDIHGLLTTLVRTAAPWLRAFPLVEHWDDQAGKALARPELFEPARSFNRIASLEGTISNSDEAKLGLLADAASEPGFQGQKAQNRVVGSFGNLVLKAAGVVATFLSGAIASDFATRSTLVQRAGSTLEKAAEEVDAFARTRPNDLRLALKAIIQDWRHAGANAAREPSDSPDQYPSAHDNRGGVTTDEIPDTPRNAFWADGHPPPWAEDWGRDVSGPWCSFRVPDTEVTQRLRWCPPGRFLMGSPLSDYDAYSSEHPQHEVAFAEGFWMFETAVTEALWSAVMGGSAPRPAFPKTEIDWTQARVFAAQVNSKCPGLSLGLPSEAQWEYACRAGTETRHSFGQTVTREQVRYGGGGPVAVASLPPNPWGLHEMHGNVWEWCEDEYFDYGEAPTDGAAWPLSGAAWPPSGAADRVFRGGSWTSDARRVRSAYRGRLRPSSRPDNIGFRCARVQREQSDSGGGVAAPADLAREHSAERATGQGRGRRHPAGAAEAPRTPVWAKHIGTDDYGTYADLAIPTGKGRFVPQRMRLIQPGTFAMGSPDDEPGRYDWEGPVHDVTLQQGFWLFDTPCTQSLWRAVMGKNPSRFKSAARPVEQVSFEDVTRFLSEVNARVDDLNLRLPSEAQWEYACRAGTSAATYAGPMEILGDNNAPVLDDIAWYGGNSGVGFELRNGYDSTGWTDKQYDHAKAGTHKVKLKAANAWGLYDMLGNIWEWCEDGWQNNYEGAPTDGSARSAGGTAYRVLRGGSWDGDARYVRAAYRLWSDPSDRGGNLGFRCARVPSEPSAGGTAAPGDPARGAPRGAPRRAT